VRIHVRVRTGSRDDFVGGRYGSEEPPTLIVRVRALPHDGHANASCRRLLARAFGVSRDAVSIIAGAKSRTKIVEVRGADPGRFHTLLGLSD